jgi:hypothetical protein
MPLVQEAAETIGLIPAWLEVDHEASVGRIRRAPRRHEPAMPIISSW